MITGRSLDVPWIVGAEIPHVSFEIATGISATAGGLDLDVQHDLGARRLGAGVVRFRVVHEQIADLRFDAADLVGLYHQVAERGLLDRSHHHHAGAERELGVKHGTFRVLDEAMRYETECLLQPRDGCGDVAIAHRRND